MCIEACSVCAASLVAVDTLRLGSIFYQLGYSQTSIQGRIGVLFFICVFTAFGIAQAAVLFIKSRCFAALSALSACVVWCFVFWCGLLQGVVLLTFCVFGASQA